MLGGGAGERPRPGPALAGLVQPVAAQDRRHRLAADLQEGGQLGRGEPLLRSGQVRRGAVALKAGQQFADSRYLDVGGKGKATAGDNGLDALHSLLDVIGAQALRQ